MDKFIYLDKIIILRIRNNSECDNRSLENALLSYNILINNK